MISIVSTQSDEHTSVKIQNANSKFCDILQEYHEYPCVQIHEKYEQIEIRSLQ